MILVFLLNNWKYVVMGVLLAAASFFYWRADVWKDKYYTFVATTKAVGEAQERATVAKTLADKLAKDTADATHTVTVNALNATIAKLRQQRAGSSIVPPAAPGSASPERASFNRAELERALQQFVGETAGLAEEGDRAVVDLNTARRWAQP